jgi:hypothetical protein
MAMTIMGTQEARTSGAIAGSETVADAMMLIPSVRD